MYSIRTVLSQTAKQLQNFTATPQLDAELLLTQILNTTREYIYSHPEQLLTPAQHQRFMQDIARRAAGEPIAYILGGQAFWTLDLQVTPDTLIPRPETELLVELVLQQLSQNAALTIADLGTGCGAIALALAEERPQWQIVATDKLAAALAVARKNAERLSIHNVTFHSGDWCAALPPGQRFAAIVSNPPYIHAEDVHLRQGGLPFEPRSALVAAENGLRDIRHIVIQARQHLAPNGLLVLEHGYDQAQAVRELLTQAGYGAVSSHCDVAGIERATVAVWRV